MKIAITGNIGGGKSTVSRILANILGAAMLDSDGICRHEMQPGNQGFVQLVEIYGDRFVKHDGGLDRDGLRSAVFSDMSVKKNLEDILHPLVLQKIEQRGLELEGKILIVEVPLLFEVGWQDQFDVTVVVRAGEGKIIDRVVARDDLEAAQVKKILDVQMPCGEKEMLADYTIDNSGTLAATFGQLQWLASSLKDKEKR
ncbi:dephospho-CoA kinase [Desulforhopalus singaporensis]|uniref:Dephospho-CoA kinase n=1 Tax=Desulforhopalus singaporensis TaxID=91360 RepID=A0A1H0MTB4_9BACT|nr:dephospho-CoA kinase [Desulforhopalus singaporensis]SDO83556.1 dephospho-CoA kinase [Desulforhopalus singaporensis]